MCRHHADFLHATLRRRPGPPPSSSSNTTTPGDESVMLMWDRDRITAVLIVQHHDSALRPPRPPRPSRDSQSSWKNAVAVPKLSLPIIIHLFCYGEIPGPCVQKAQAKVCEKDSKVKNKEAFNTVVVLIACVIQKEQNNESLTGKTRTAGRTIAVGTCWGLARKGVLVF
uniref:Uncharacterized protein n=2 Tax=Oryza glumipatula TaxID=40148 RepID=A0A0D9ZA88_9ORYZ